MRLEDNVIEDIRSDIERAERVDTDLDLTDWLNRKWFPGVKDFLFSTLSVIKTILFPTEDGESVAKSKESIKRKTGKRKHKEIKHSGRSTLKMVYQNLCETFGALFFLGKIRTVGKTIVVGDKLMTSTPDCAYPLASVPQAGLTLGDCRLLFIVEVKGTSINNVSSECLEEQLDSYVLGQVGSQLPYLHKQRPLQCIQIPWE